MRTQMSPKVEIAIEQIAEELTRIRLILQSIDHTLSRPPVTIRRNM